MAPDGGAFVPPPEPLTAEMLPVSDGHSLYVETVGHPEGIPAVYLHGGPGSGCQASHRRLFNAARFCAVLFDQRGAGRSLPARSRDANTTQHLIDDMETIRRHFGIERWLVVGGSWGATLALAYAERFPKRVTGLVLRAVYLGTREEIDRAFGSVLATFRPELHADFLALLDPHERAEALDAYFRRILDPDPAIHGPAARAFADTERSLSEARAESTHLNLREIVHPSDRLPATAFMEAHYLRNGCFLRPNQLLDDAHRLRGIPGIIVQGRYDLLCPPATAWALARCWGRARIEMVEGAGHSLSDPGVEPAVRAAIDSFI